MAKYTNYEDIKLHLANLEPFNGNTMRAEKETDTGTYKVYSYNTPIAIVTGGGQVSINDYKYSATTSRHQNLVKQWLGLNVLTTHNAVFAPGYGN